MNNKKSGNNDIRFKILIYSLFVIICGLWYSNYKQDLILNTYTNEKTVSLIQENVVSKPIDDRININTADKEDLMTLKGIGESKAAAIIYYRQQNGGFKSIEEIKNVEGIGDKTFKNIKDKIIIQ